MSILLGILAAMGTLGVILWRLNAAAEAAKGLAETANDARGLFRRWRWQNRFAADTLDLVTDPREAAAAMMVATAQYDGAMSEREREAILASITGVLGATAKQAEDLLAHARWLTRDSRDLDRCLMKLALVLQKSCTPDQCADVVAMMQRVADADGEPSDVIRASLQGVGRTLRI